MAMTLETAPADDLHAGLPLIRRIAELGYRADEAQADGDVAAAHRLTLQLDAACDALQDYLARCGWIPPQA